MPSHIDFADESSRDAESLGDSAVSWLGRTAGKAPSEAWWCPGSDASWARLPLKPRLGLGRALVLTHASLWVPWEAQNDSKKEVVDQRGGKMSEVCSSRGSSKCRQEIASSLAGGRKAYMAGNNFMANATPWPGAVGCAHSEGSQWHWGPLLNRSLQNG